MKNVIVVLESFGDDAAEINRSLLSEGGRLADSLGGTLDALVVENMPDDLSVLEESNTTNLYHLRGEMLSAYQSEVSTWAISSFVKKQSPRLLLLAHSDMGSVLAPGIAANRGTSAITDVLAIKAREGELFYVKSCYSEQFEQEISYAPGLLEIASIRHATSIVGKKGQKKTIRKVEVAMDVPAETARTSSLGQTAPDFRTVDIVHAKRIIGVGMGCANEACLSEAEELAEKMQASIATTRPVVDEGHLPKSRMIGMTGKTVAPEFYLSLGISGSPHHVAGIQKAGKVVSINKDAGAPIFQVSDIGFHADLKEILPLLNRRIEEWRRSKQ